MKNENQKSGQHGPNPPPPLLYNNLDKYYKGPTTKKRGGGGGTFEKTLHSPEENVFEGTPTPPDPIRRTPLIPRTQSPGVRRGTPVPFTVTKSGFRYIREVPKNKIPKVGGGVLQVLL